MESLGKQKIFVEWVCDYTIHNSALTSHVLLLDSALDLFIHHEWLKSPYLFLWLICPPIFNLFRCTFISLTGEDGREK